MAGLAHDGHLGDTVQERLGREARPQTMAGIEGSIQSGGGSGALHHAGDGPGVQAARGHAAVAVHGSKRGAEGQRRGRNPCTIAAYRTRGGGGPVRQGDAGSLPFRIHLRPPHAQDQPVSGFGYVGDIQIGEFRPPESTGVAHQEQGPVPDADQAVIEPVEHFEDIGGEERLLAGLRRAQGRRMPFMVSLTTACRMVAGERNPAA